MEKKVHFLTGNLKLFSPAIIGSGKDDETDIDLILNADNKPFIPATSLAGVLRHLSYSYSSKDEINQLWGFTEAKNAYQSILLFSDLQGTALEIGRRTGVKINNFTGTAEEKALYEYQIIESGSFELKIEAISKNDVQEELIKKSFLLFNHLFKEKIVIGAKTNSGFGLIGTANGSDLDYYCLVLNDTKHLVAWLKNEPKNGNKIQLNNIAPIKIRKKYLELKMELCLKSSLIIRDYSVNPNEPDAVSLKCGYDYVISGTSLKGALRSRAERILNTIGNDENKTDSLIKNLFGYVEERPRAKKAKQKGSRGRLRVEEVKLHNFAAEQQTRIKIDRFTGGAISGALFEEMPVFSEGPGNSKIIQIKLTVDNFNDWEVGLILLLIKDLWTGDLPMGGEKSIGRGVCEGKSAIIILYDTDKDPLEYQFKLNESNCNISISKNKSDGDQGNIIKELNEYINKLHDQLKQNPTSGGKA